MAVDIELFGQLSTGRPGRQRLLLERRMTVREVASVLGVKPEEVGLIFVNGVQSDTQDPVPPDCRLCFFPFLSGG